MNTDRDTDRDSDHDPNFDVALSAALIKRRRLLLRGAEVLGVVDRWLVHGEEPARRSAPPPPARSVPRSGRVLLVEDDDDFADSIAGCLRGAGFDVARARGVPDAVEMLDREGFGSVVVDFDLNGDFGGEVVEHARASNPAARVVLMSGVVPERLPQIAARLRVVDILPKPFPPSALLLTLGAPPGAGATAH
jgi:CheY-like chemotaxis protein